jgi:transcriptional regulator with XRE-family HTH domain
MESKSEISKEIGNKVRKAREEARLTQLEVANTSGINVTYYAQIERGEVNPSIDKVQRIAKTLNITIDIS